MKVVIKEKEIKERNRQVVLFREYFNRRREVYETRLAKFLKMYPYSGIGNNVDLFKYEVTVKGVDFIQRNAILQAFQQEKDYWNSSYVANSCRCNIYEHIISTLSAMEKVLTGIGYSNLNKLIVANQPDYGWKNTKNATTSTKTKSMQDTNH